MLKRRRFLALAVVSVLATALTARAEIQLTLSSLGTATQSGGSSVPNPASLAIDGNTGTYSQTPDVTNSFWEVELVRAVCMTRIELVAPSDAGNGLVLRVFNLRDQTLFEATVTGVSGGSTWSTNLPSPVEGRIVRIGLENGRTNGVGDYRTTLAEVRVFGDPSPARGPVTLGAAAAVSQSSTNAAFGASNAADGNPGTYSETLDALDSYWLLTLDRAQPIQGVELVNRSDGSAVRMQGLTLRILDGASNSVASATVPNPGASNNWVYAAPPDTTGRYIRIGLENGAVNGEGNRIVSLAEVSVLTATNLALGADSFMMRFTDSLPPTSNGNDGRYATYMETTSGAADGYLEVDLGETRALYSVRVVAADGFQARIAHTTVRLFDEAHDSVFSQHLAGTAETFDVPLPGAVLARYVRVGLENKERTSPTGGTEWWIRIKELQAFGRPSNEAGILTFTATQTQIVSGASTDLRWQEAALYQLDLHPGVGSVGARVDAAGSGTFSVAPASSVEYVLVGSNYGGHCTRALTIEVDGQALPAQISEFVADNALSLRDGRKEAPDWIELHNPNNTPLDLAGCYLSDDPPRR